MSRSELARDVHNHLTGPAFALFHVTCWGAFALCLVDLLVGALPGLLSMAAPTRLVTVMLMAKIPVMILGKLSFQQKLGSVWVGIGVLLVASGLLGITTLILNRPLSLSSFFIPPDNDRVFDSVALQVTLVACPCQGPLSLNTNS